MFTFSALKMLGRHTVQKQLLVWVTTLENNNLSQFKTSISKDLFRNCLLIKLQNIKICFLIKLN